jgi:hypothetical protein
MAIRYGYNPITAEWVVLSEIMNGYPFATDAETLAGTVDVKAVTPASLKSIKDVDTGIVGKDANGEILVDGINIATDDLANPDPRNITWNIDDGTLDVELYDGVVMQVGEELMIRGKAVEDILDGQVVMFGGALGDNIKLKVADASAEGFLPRWILGIATHNIDQNKWGYVTKVGKVRGVNTTAFAEGAVVYFDPTTPGGLTDTQPEAPCCKVPMGAILRSQNDGIIFVRPEFNPSMFQINDVHIASIADNNILKWNATASRFENVAYPVVQTITNGVTDKAPSEDAVFDALALKLDIEDLPASTLPEILEGDAGKVVIVNSTEDGFEYSEISSGVDGTDGNTILGGTVDPTTEGVDGDIYLNYTTWHIWSKTSGTWSDLGSIKGADGTNGTDGTDGSDGVGIPTISEGDSGKVLAVKTDESGAEWIDAPTGGTSGGVSLGLVIALS